MSAKEYYGSGTNSGSRFSTLGCYYGAGSTMPALKANQVNNVQIVPQWGGPGYDALTHGVNCDGGYFNITNAYGAGAATCSTSYAQRLCGGCNTAGGGTGWSCQAGFNGKKACVPGGRLGTRGVFGSPKECQKNC
jgi:hypothetical protein